jgi:hypothetical protein
VNNILENRQFLVAGSWHAPLKKLKEYESVIDAEYLEMCSSAGDWTGIFFQQIGDTTYAIPFCQENNYPRQGGYTLWTGDTFCHFSDELTRDLKEEIVKHFIELYY